MHQHNPSKPQEPTLLDMVAKAYKPKPLDKASCITAYSEPQQNDKYAEAISLYLAAFRTLNPEQQEGFIRAEEKMLGKTQDRAIIASFCSIVNSYAGNHNHNRETHKYAQIVAELIGKIPYLIIDSTLNKLESVISDLPNQYKFRFVESLDKMVTLLNDVNINSNSIPLLLNALCQTLLPNNNPVDSFDNVVAGLSKLFDIIGADTERTENRTKVSKALEITRGLGPYVVSFHKSLAAHSKEQIVKLHDFDQLMDLKTTLDRYNNPTYANRILQSIMILYSLSEQTPQHSVLAKIHNTINSYILGKPEHSQKLHLKVLTGLCNSVKANGCSSDELFELLYYTKMISDFIKQLAKPEVYIERFCGNWTTALMCSLYNQRGDDPHSESLRNLTVGSIGKIILNADRLQQDHPSVNRVDILFALSIHIEALSASNNQSIDNSIYAGNQLMKAALTSKVNSSFRGLEPVYLKGIFDLLKSLDDKSVVDSASEVVKSLAQHHAPVTSLHLLGQLSLYLIRSKSWQRPTAEHYNALRDIVLACQGRVIPFLNSLASSIHDCDTSPAALLRCAQIIRESK